jgi:hypothetical protein
MLENLFQLVKEQGQTDVVDNPAVPNEQNNAVMAEASQAIAGTMQNALASGQTEQVQQLFQTDDTNQLMGNPLAQNMQGSFIDSITSKFGINKNVAMGIAASLIPIVLSKLVRRTNSSAPQDSGFDLGGLIGSLTGGGGGLMGGSGINMGNVLGQLTSSGNGGGGFNLQDVIAQVTNGAKNQQQQGGLQSIIKGFFGN